MQRWMLVQHHNALSHNDLYIIAAEDATVEYSLHGSCRDGYVEVVLYYHAFQPCLFTFCH